VGLRRDVRLRMGQSGTSSVPPAVQARRAGTALAPLPSRWPALIAATAGLGFIFGAARLDPSPVGHGTHTQLGLPPCLWAAAADFPCPTCGITTAVAQAADGQLLDAARTQPFGLLVALAVSASTVAALHSAVFRSAVLARLCQSVVRPRVLVWVAAAALVAWGYKMATW